MMRSKKVNINEYLFIHIKLSSKANSRAMLNVLTHSHCLKAVNIEGPKPEVLFTNLASLMLLKRGGGKSLFRGKKERNKVVDRAEHTGRDFNYPEGLFVAQRRSARM